MLDAIKLESSKFQNVLKSLRVRRGKEWTQKKTAEYLSEGLPEYLTVSLRLYVGWENGDSLPSPEQLKIIATKFILNQEEEETLYHAAARVPPKILHLPFPPNPFFIDRKATDRKTYLEQLREFFKENGRVALTQPVSISGLGGIGKTQLALAYAYSSYPKVYHVVLWVNAAAKTTLQADYDTLAQKLGLPEQNERELDKRVQAVKQWLADHTSWLLIMDNADDLQLARAFFPEINHGHILLTTRSQFAGKIGARQIEVDKMEPEEGLVFLLRRTRMLETDTNLDTVAKDIRESALQLVKLLDGHPLALDQAGAFIEETGMSFPEYIKLYQKQRRDLLNKYGALERKHSEHPEYSQHPETVVVTFELCFTKARELHPLAADILHFCAFLQPDAIPEELFQQDDSFKVDALEFNAGIAALQRYSLIKRNTQDKICSLHRLVQAVLIDAISPDIQKQWRDRVARALLAALPEVDFGNWRQWERLRPHASVWATLAEDELTPTEEVGTLFYRAGLYLYNRGQPSEAEPLVARALSIYQQHFGVEDSVTAIVLNDLAVLYMVQGKFSHAEPLYLQALAIQERQLGAEHPQIARSLTDLAMLYLIQGMYGQAEPLIVRALSIRENHLGAEHPDTARSLHMLAHLYHTQGKYGQAEPLYRRALEIFEKRLGVEHPDNALTLYWLAMLLHKQGQHEQAVALYQRSLSIQEQQLGGTHPTIKATKKAYADYLHSIGRDTEAAALEVDDEPSV